MNHENRPLTPQKPRRATLSCYIPEQFNRQPDENPLDYELRVTRIGWLIDETCDSYMAGAIEEAKNPTPHMEVIHHSNKVASWIGVVIAAGAFLAFMDSQLIVGALVLFCAAICFFFGHLGRNEYRPIRAKAYKDPQWVIDRLDSYEKKRPKIPEKIRQDMDELKSRLPAVEIYVLHFHLDPLIKVTYKDVASGKIYSRYIHCWDEPGLEAKLKR